MEGRVGGGCSLGMLGWRGEEEGGGEGDCGEEEGEMQLHCVMLD